MYGLGRNVSTVDTRDYPLSAYIRGVTSAKEKIWTFEDDAQDMKLMHVFLNEMREEGIDHEERVATMLSKAFLWTREAMR